MPLLRPKQANIYGTVWNWYLNMGGVSYIAHAVTAAGVTAFGGEEDGAGGSPINHPDQVFWRDANRVHWPAAGGVLRIEIDCSLMPCSAGDDCCLYAVPEFLAANGYANKPLRIFSHRYEGGLIMQNKRVFSCNSSDNRLALAAAMGNHENWYWVGNDDPRVNNAGYHLF